jgi:tetratricopeptide (TPR) repeat protein
MSSILDDKTTEERDRIDLSAETAAAYQAVMVSMETASALVPSKAFYRKTLSDIHLQAALWAKAMHNMDVPPVAGIGSSGMSLDLARKHLERAVFLDPLNADYHLALGRLFRESDGVLDRADREFQLAVGLHPVNVQLRYAVAREYLLQGEMEKALGQAEMLARIDESYRMDDDDPGCVLARERRSPWYISRLAGSYLIKSMEIAWRASGKDAEKVAAIVPDNIDAQETARLFFEFKGIDHEGLPVGQK